MTATRDSSIAARIPLDLRADLEALAGTEAGHDLSAVIRRLLREGADQRLGRTPTGAAGLLAGPGRSRRRDPATAKAAASRVAPRAGTQRRRALEAIIRAGAHGATADEVIASMQSGGRDVAVNGIARRVADLKEAGAISTIANPITADGDPITRPTRHGAEAEVYVATELGRAWLAEVSG
jgi:hypothetical protein